MARRKKAGFTVATYKNIPIIPNYLSDKEKADLINAYLVNSIRMIQSFTIGGFDPFDIEEDRIKVIDGKLSCGMKGCLYLRDGGVCEMNNTIMRNKPKYLEHHDDFDDYIFIACNLKESVKTKW